MPENGENEHISEQAQGGQLCRKAYIFPRAKNAERYISTTRGNPFASARCDAKILIGVENNLMKNSHFKKALSMFLSILMVFSCFAGMPVLIGHDHTHAEAAISDFEVELAFNNIFVFDKWANNVLSTTIVSNGIPVKNELMIDIEKGSFTFTNPDTTYEAYTGHGMGTGQAAAGNYQYYYMEVEPGAIYSFTYNVSNLADTASIVPYVFFFNEDNEYISHIAQASGNGEADFTFDVPVTAHYIQVRFTLPAGVSTVTVKDIAIRKTDIASRGNNIFDFSAWAGNANSNAVSGLYGQGSLTVDSSANSVTLKPNADGAMLFTGFSLGSKDGFYTVDIAPNAKYCLTYNLITGGAVGAYTPYVVFHRADGTMINYVNSTAAQQGANQYIFTTPGDAAYMQVVYAVSGGANNTTYTVSDVALQKLTLAENMYTDVSHRQVYTYKADGSNKYTNLPEPSYAPGGYVFAGWYTGKDGTGMRITENTPVDFTSYTVYAKYEPAVDSISIAESAAKTEYTVGERVNPTGLVLNATIGNNTTTVDSGYYCTPEYLTATDTQITVSYGGKTVTYPVTVRASASKSVVVNGTDTAVSVTNNAYTFASTVANSDFTRYELTYYSDAYVRGIITYGDNSTEEFFLEPSANFDGVTGEFASYVDGYLTKVLASLNVTDYVESSMKNGIKAIRFEMLDNKSGTFELLSVKTEKVNEMPATITSADINEKTFVHFSNDDYTVGIDLVNGGVVTELYANNSTVEARVYNIDGKNVTKVDYAAKLDADYGTNYISRNTSVNLINLNDTGRYLQQSYYGTGEKPYEQGYYNNADWNYNPVQAGNVAGEASKVIDFEINTEENYIYVKTRPLDWSKWSDNFATEIIEQQDDVRNTLKISNPNEVTDSYVKRYGDDYITDTYVESKYVFEDGMIKVYNRKVDYSGLPAAQTTQELPAFYTIEPLNNYVYNDVTADEAWTSTTMNPKWDEDPEFWGVSDQAYMDAYYDGGHPVANHDTPEHWSAFMASKATDSFGIGLYSPEVTNFYYGVYPPKYQDNIPRNAQTEDPALEVNTSYISPIGVRTFQSYEPTTYEYYVSTGTLNQIRYSFGVVDSEEFAAMANKAAIAVPETIYMTPSTGESKTGQYYVNNILDKATNAITPEADNDNTNAYVQFNLPGAKDVTIAVNTLTSGIGDIVLNEAGNIQAGNLTNSYEGISLGAIIDADGYFSYKTTGLYINGTGLTAGQTAVAEWVFTITMQDGSVRTYYAYSTLYAQHRSVGAAAESRRSSSYNGGINSWIAGINGVSSSKTSIGSLSGDKQAEGYYTNDPLTNLTVAATGKTEDATDIITASATEKYVCSCAPDGSDGTNSQSYLGYIYIDSSRYTSTSQLPNFYIGSDIVHKGSSLSDYNAWYVLGTSSTTANGSGDSPSGWGTISVNKENSAGTRTTVKPAYNVSDLNGKQIHVRSMVASNYVFSKTYGNAYASAEFVVLDKSDLRELVLEASTLNAADYTEASWNAYIAQVRTAAASLGNPSASSVMDTTALVNARNALQTNVYFDANGGDSVAASSATFTIGAKTSAAYSTTNTATRTGYTFKGWSADKNATTGAADFTLTFNQTLYAVWEINSYTVTFKDSDGTTLKTQTVTYGGSANAPIVPAKPGEGDVCQYTFSGWDQAFTNVTSDLTVTAQYAAVAHSYSVSGTDATCTTDGERTFTCSVCSHSYTETIGATGHTEVTVAGKAATCTEPGLTDGKKCSVCGTVIVAQQTIPELGHLDENSDHVCDRGCGIAQGTCSDSATDNDHVCDYGCGKVLEACSDASGDGNHNCDICGADNVTEHVKGEEKRENITDATCDAAGEYDSVYYCTECNAEMERTNDVTIDKLPHSWKDATYTWSADGKTCTVTRVCANFASHTESETVNATGVQNVAPTCEEKGSTIYTATFTVDWASTQTTEIYDIPEKGHTAGDVVVENKKAPTCTADGSYDNVTYCTVCNKEIARNTVTDPATGHTPAAAVEENRTESTCTVAGSYDSVVYCSVCKAEISRTKVDLPLAAHTEEIIPAVAPTCTEKGKTEGKKCSVCGEILVAQTDVAPLGHDWAETTYSFADDGSSCSATRVCNRDASHVETANAEITPAVKNPATCTEKGTTTYTATFTEDWAKEQSKDVDNIAALEHAWSATYTSNGDGKDNTHYQTCTRENCGAKNTAVPHTWDNGKITTSATCTTDGVTTYTCTASGCGATYTEAISQTGHTPAAAVEENRNEATCTVAGSYESVVYCSVCKAAISRTTETIAAAGHQFGSVTPAKAATCVATGNEAYKSCTVCNKFFAADAEPNSTAAKDNADAFTTQIDPDNHDLKTTAAKAPTCTEIGWDEYVTCQREGCGYTTYKAIEAKGHDYDLTTGTNNNNGTHTVTCPNCDENTEGHTDVVDCTYGAGVVTDPTCTKNGYTTHTCTVCGYFYTDTETTATGHTFGNWTANNDGTHTRTCTACIDEEGRNETADCTYGEWTETKAPTCTEKGEKAHTCTVCNNTVTEEVEALGHEYGEADCTKPATCTRCDATTGEALGHDFTVFVETVDYTCTEKGYDIYKCSRCDATENKNYTDAACRPEADYTVTKQATCEADGEKSIFCSVCDKALVTTVIVKREHVYKDNGVQTAATCVAEGVMNTICTNEETAEYAACAHESTRVIPVDKDAHKWETEYTVDKKASCDAAGSKSYHCALCDAKNEDSVVEIAKREHNLVDTTEEKAATCTEDGVMNQKCNHTGSDEYEACTYTTTRVIKAKGHTLTQVAAQAPTCEGIGWEAYEKCSVCDYTTYKEIAKLGHDWSVTYTWTEDNASCTATRVCANDAKHNLTETVTAASAVKIPATCTEKGTTTYTATFSVDWAKEQSKDVVDIAALGHDYEGVETKAPTCTEKGVMTYTCKNDASHTYDEDIAALNHIDADNNGYCDRCNALICDHVGQDTVLKDDKEATCTEDGYTGDKHCAKCDVIVEYGEKIDKLGHAWSETYTSNGNGKDATHYQTCTRENCGVKNEAVAHTWNDGVVTTDPTCEGEGVKTFTCTAKECGATYTEAVAANGHSYGEWINEVAATCINTGVKGHYECSVCHKNFDAEKAELTDLTIAIDGSNHVTTTDHEQTDATCLTVGYTAGTFCEDCDKWISGHEEIPAIAHKNKVHHERVESTCSKTGTIEYWSCPDCSKNFSDEACNTAVTDLTVAINPEAHKWDEGTVTTEPGCHQMGIKTYTCEYDKTHTKPEEIGYDLNNHINTENHDAVKETCTSVGYTAGVYCTDCKAYISGHEVIAAINHKNKVHHAKIDATCVATGTIEYWSCPDCGKNFSDEACNTAVTDLTIAIDPDNHDLKTTEAKAPTCTEIGWDAYVTCQREGCNYTTYVEKEANGHAYDLTTGVTAEDGKHTVTCPNCAEGTEGHTKVVACTYGEGVVTAPTCTKNGYTTHTCTACGYFYTDSETTAVGHTFGNWTANNDGTHTRTCTVCTDEEGRVETADCTYGEWTETMAPTCTEKGEKAHTCSVCNNTVTAEVEALGHNWADADCTKPSTCMRCGETSGAAIGHDFTVFVETVDYTCTTDGYTTYKCIRCEETEIRDITKAAHRPAADFAVIEKASCDKDGYKAILCTACGKELETETIAKREHHLVDTTVEKAPTCSATGIMNQKCDCAETAEYEACDYTTTRVMDKVADAHKAETDYIQTVAPTCSAVGEEKLYCEYCDAVLDTREVAIDADAHKWETEYTVDKKASCEEAGSKSYHCEYCDAINADSVAEIAKREHNLVDTTVALAPTCSATGTMNQKCDHVGSDEYEACTYTTTRVMDKVADAHKAEADYTVIVKATCEADGYKAILCEYCDAELSKETIAKRAHVYVDNGVKTAATCVAEGVMNTICTNEETAEYAACAHESTRVIPVDPDAHKAEADYTVIVKATCEADGYKAILCEYCDAELSKETIAKREHVYVDNGVQTAATCAATGVMNTICTNAETDTHKACAHESTRVIAIDPDAHNWNEGAVTTKPICTENGVKTFTCKNDASHTYTEVIPMLNHDYVTTVTAPTCTEEGFTTYTCRRGDHTYVDNYVDALGHKYEAVVTAPTCTAEGFTTYTCSVCDDSYVADKVAALGHIEGEVVVENKVEPDCVNDGSYDNVVYCTVCDAELSRETVTVDALGHKYKAVVTAPTCTAEGFTTYTCSVCDDSYVADKVTALGHTEGEVVVENEVAATCTKEGSYENVVYCTVCDAELSRETVTVDKIAHTAAQAAKENEIAATCEENGSYDMVVRCAVCKEILSSESFTTDAIGHDYKLDNLVRPTKQADGTWGNGYETYVCQNDPKHIETKLVERADYTEYDKIVEELEERLEDETLSDEVRAEIEDLLENNKVEPDRIASEQDAVSDAAESIVSGSTSYLKTYKVTFVADGNVISEQTVFYGAAAIAPEAPQKEGFIFTGWSGAYTNVKADTTVTATYYEGDIILTLSASDLSVAVGKTAQLTATVLPAEKNDLELTWSVADSAIAKVDANGIVTGLKNGITTVTVSAFDGNISATATVYVYNTNGDYTVQLAKSPFGNFVVGDYTFYETAYINVRPGQEFRFRFALSGGYTADDVIITVNGMEISVDSENYFTIPYATDNLTILAVPAPGSGLGGNGNGSDSDSDSGSNSTAHSCWCHSGNKLLQFLWKILMFFCRIFGIEKYHYCGCGKAHW